jgi:hypothetical protein
MGFGLIIGFIKHLKTVTRSNYSAIANLYSLEFTTAHTVSSQSAAFISRCLVTDPNKVLCFRLSQN